VAPDAILYRVSTGQLANEIGCIWKKDAVFYLYASCSLSPSLKAV